MNLKGTRFTQFLHTGFKGRVALITGAGSGIGQQLAIDLADQGTYCYLVDVNESGLKETEQLIQKAKEARCETIVTDVASFDAIGLKQYWLAINQRKILLMVNGYMRLAIHQILLFSVTLRINE